MKQATCVVAFWFALLGFNGVSSAGEGRSLQSLTGRLEFSLPANASPDASHHALLTPSPPTPLPASLLLFASGLASLGLLARQRRRKA